jgi:hypothetical protein
LRGGYERSVAGPADRAGNRRGDVRLRLRHDPERAEKQHKKVVEFDETDRKRIRSLGRFCLVLPFAFAGFFWLVWG